MSYAREVVVLILEADVVGTPEQSNFELIMQTMSATPKVLTLIVFRTE